MLNWWIHLILSFLLSSNCRWSICIWSSFHKMCTVYLRHDWSCLCAKHCWLLELTSDIRRVFELFSSLFVLEPISFFSSLFSAGISFFTSLLPFSSVTILNVLITWCRGTSKHCMTKYYTGTPTMFAVFKTWRSYFLFFSS